VCSTAEAPPAIYMWPAIFCQIWLIRIIIRAPKRTRELSPGETVVLNGAGTSPQIMVPLTSYITSRPTCTETSLKSRWRYTEDDQLDPQNLGSAHILLRSTRSRSNHQTHISGEGRRQAKSWQLIVDLLDTGGRPRQRRRGK